jgi:hypothetical protein
MLRMLVSKIKNESQFDEDEAPCEEDAAVAEEQLNAGAEADSDNE